MSGAPNLSGALALGDVRDRLTNIMADLVFLAQDAALAASAVDCPKRDNCPLLNSAKELAVKVREFLTAQRETTNVLRPPSPPPTPRARKVEEELEEE